MKRWRRRRDGADDAYASIPSTDERVTWEKPPAPGDASPPARPVPGPPRRTLTIDLYDDGHAETYDYQRQRWAFTPGKPPAIDLSDAALERFLRDQH